MSISRRRYTRGNISNSALTSLMSSSFLIAYFFERVIAVRANSLRVLQTFPAYVGKNNNCCHHDGGLVVRVEFHEPLETHGENYLLDKKSMSVTREI